MAITLTTEEMIGVIAGSVGGGIILLLVFILCGYYCCCRSRRYRNDDKPPKRIPENPSNGYTNRVALPAAKLGTVPKPDDQEDLEAAKAVGYAYPIVGGRPVSYPYFGATNLMRQNPSPPSSAGAKTQNPVQRQPSVGLPPNAYRLPGLADKSLSMSDSNLSTVGTINPAYDPSGDIDTPSSGHVYRTQSLMNVVDRRDPDRQSNDQWKRSSYQPQPQYKSSVYQYDGLHGQVTNRPYEGSSASSNKRDFTKRLSSCDEEVGEASSLRNSSNFPDSDRRAAPLKIRVAHELEAADQVHALPSKQRKKAPEVPAAPKGLPRIPLEAPAEIEEEPPSSPRINPETATRRSLTSEMSYRAKGNLVTAQAFDFLEGYTDDGPRS